MFVALLSPRSSLIRPSFGRPSPLLQSIDEIYAKFLSGEIKPEGKDLCDMSDTTGKRTFDQYSIVNAMLPTKYN